MQVRDLTPHEGFSTCRLCRLAYERLEHLAACPIIHQLFLTFHSLVLDTTTITDTCSPMLKLLGCTRSSINPDELIALPPGLYSFFLILWKFTIWSFTSVDTNSDHFPPTKIWIDTLKRFKERTNALRHSLYLRHVGAIAKGTAAPSSSKLNHSLYPLAHFTDEAALSYHPALETLFTHYSLPPDTTTDPSTDLSASSHQPINFIKPTTQPG